VRRLRLLGVAAASGAAASPFAVAAAIFAFDLAASAAAGCAASDAAVAAAVDSAAVDASASAQVQEQDDRAGRVGRGAVCTAYSRARF
jgi:chromosome condensin MukBEF MukE localization factor